MGRLIRIALVGLLLAILWLPTPAIAVSWYQTAEYSRGQEAQYVDLDSLQRLGSDRLQVQSYYVDGRAGEPQRTDYLTEYNCRTRQFRDLQRNGQPYSQPWSAVDGDYLNAETLDYVCDLASN